MSDEYNEPKLRKCSQDGCEITATHTLVWTSPNYYCPIHVRQVIDFANIMGFDTPLNTLRKLEPLEMIDDSED